MKSSSSSPCAPVHERWWWLCSVYFDWRRSRGCRAVCFLCMSPNPNSPSPHNRSLAKRFDLWDERAGEKVLIGRPLEAASNVFTNKAQTSMYHRAWCCCWDAASHRTQQTPMFLRITGSWTHFHHWVNPELFFLKKYEYKYQGEILIMNEPHPTSLEDRRCCNRIEEIPIGVLSHCAHSFLVLAPGPSSEPRYVTENTHMFWLHTSVLDVRFQKKRK